MYKNYFLAKLTLYFVIRCQSKGETCELSGFCSGTVQVSVGLGCDATSLGVCSLTFRGSVVIWHPGFEISVNLTFDDILKSRA